MFFVVFLVFLFTLSRSLSPQSCCSFVSLRRLFFCFSLFPFWCFLCSPIFSQLSFFFLFVWFRHCDFCIFSFGFLCFVIVFLRFFNRNYHLFGVSAFSDQRFPLDNVVSMVRGNSLISHLLLLIASRHWHVHWHSEIRQSENNLDCEDSQLVQSNFQKVARV